MDYGLAAALMAAALGMGGDGAPMWTLLAAAAAVLGLSLLTDYEWGVRRRTPVPVHMGGDLLIGLALAVSPWMLGFAGVGAAGWAPHVVAGLVLIGAALTTQPRAYGLEHPAVLAAQGMAVARRWAGMAPGERAMPVTLLLWLGLGGFFAAAAIGAALLMAHARRRHMPVAPAFAHGFFAGSGLILLIIAVIYGWRGGGGGIGAWPVVALAILLVAATLGATLLYLHVRTGSIPMKLGVAHGATAATGVVVLFLAMVARSYTGGPVPLDPREIERQEAAEREAAELEGEGAPREGPPRGSAPQGIRPRD
jgi:hypothetical protein